MAKAKSLFEKVWWVIPPVVVVLVLPLRMVFWDMVHYDRPLSSFVGRYEKYFLDFLFYHFFDFWGVIIALLTIAFMGIGYYLSRRKSIAIRTVVPIIAAIIGYYFSFILLTFFAWGIY
ncbi:MAG TPA: hypothetical protein VMW67_04370 [Desulfobacteria bacterium]|nr:hypothetical protein [Desulfobacteria bacterium]